MRFEGLTELQNDLLKSSKNAERAYFRAMQTAGNASTREARKMGRKLVKRDTGRYQKGFKRGKVFKDPEGNIVVRVLNKDNKAHLIEYGHRIVDKNGKEHGFQPGKLVLAKGVEQYERVGDFEQELSKAVDKLLEQGRL